MRHQRPVALVTGGGKRLGREIALVLGDNGFDIAVNYNHSKLGAQKVIGTLKSKGVHAIALKANLNDVHAIRQMVNSVVREFDRIDVLINNAAIFPTIGLNDVTPKIWDETLNVNLRGMFFCCQAVGKQMLKQKSGRIINIASLGGIQPWTTHIPYNVSKAGVIMLTRCLAKALAPDIRVNAIAPGTILIEGEESRKTKHINRQKILLRRYGIPRDITDMVLFLATKGDYITGQIFLIDGGRSVQ